MLEKPLEYGVILVFVIITKHLLSSFYVPGVEDVRNSSFKERECFLMREFIVWLSDSGGCHFELIDHDF